MTDEVKSTWISSFTSLVQQLGFPVVACAAVAWFGYRTLEWERNQMIPALMDSKTAISNNTKTMERVLEELGRKRIGSVGSN